VHVTHSLADSFSLLSQTHLRTLGQWVSDSVELTEAMLRQQIVAAIGKHVEAADFGRYMTFHNRKLFKGIYEPRPFCYAVRRPEHDPEGVVSIENADEDASPIYTLARERNDVQAPMRFRLSAATEVRERRDSGRG